MHVAIARPVPARNNTAFEAQLACYEHLQASNQVDVTVIADRYNDLRTDDVQVIECEPSLNAKLTSIATRGLNKLTGRYDFISQDYPVLASIIEQRDFDVVETSDPTLYPYAETVANACERTGTALVCGSSVTLDIDTPIPIEVARRVFEAVNGVICPTPLAHDRFARLGLLSSDDDRVVYTGHPIDTERFTPGSSGEGPLTALSVGRLEARKGFRYLVDAVDRVRSRGVDLTWEIVGEGPLRGWITDTVRERGLDDVVTFHGEVDHGDIPRYYRDADLFLLHSLRTEDWEEYFGVVYAEAMSSGLPVVGSHSGAIPWVVRDGTDGILVPERDADTIADALERLCTTPDLREHMGMRGRENVRDRFSIPIVAEKLLTAWGATKPRD